MMYSDQLQKPPGQDFWKWIETAQHQALITALLA